MATLFPKRLLVITPALLVLLAASPPPGADASKSEAPDGREVSGAWVDEARESVRRGEYRFSSLDMDVWSAPNRAHGIRSRVHRGGIELFPRETGASGAGASWKVSFRTTAFGRVGRVLPLETRDVTANGARADLDHGALLEWFVNDDRGLEQGWTIEEPPPGAGPLRICVSIEGDLTLELGADADAGALVDSEGREQMFYGGLAAWDAMGTALEVRMTATTSGVELEVRAEGASYPITVDPLLTSASWTTEPNQGAANLGWSVASAGDVDGDGYDDVIIGAWKYDAGQVDEGRAFVFLGSSGGLGHTPAWSAEPNQVRAYLGFAVATAGDVNGDGYSDVVVGAPGYTDPGSGNVGAAFVYHGSEGGLGLTASWTVISQLDEDPLGPASTFAESVAGAGDVNGDGFSDVIIGQHDASNGNFLEGVAMVFLGSASGLSTIADWLGESNQWGADYGQSLASAGDVNGDGYDDVLVGAPRFGWNSNSGGKVYLYLGSATGPATVEDWSLTFNHDGDELGYSVASAGDVDGDGYDDLIVGQPGYPAPAQQEGRALVFAGSANGPGSTAVWTATVPQAMARTGNSVAAAGDVNGDGYSDVAVGATGYANGESAEGLVRVYLGSAAGLSPTELWSAESDQAQSGFGSSLAGAGDVDGDGFDDVLVGAPTYDNVEGNEGRAYLFSGFAATSAVSYCTAGTSASGCAAQLSSTGLASATAASGFTLNASSVEGAKDGLYFFGTSGRQANPWGTGTSFQCVMPPVNRTGLLTGVGGTGTCDGTFARDLNALWCPACSKPNKNPGPGAVVQAQLWYRDPLNTSNQSTSLSDAIEFVVAP